MIDAEAQPMTSDLAPLDVHVTPLYSDGQSEAALDESLSQEDALTVEDEKEVEEPEVSEEEEEWPSLGLDVEVREQVVEVKDEKEVEEPEVSEEEEEWPSLGLDVEAKEEVVEAKDEKEFEESEVSEEEEEWPSNRSIPGLELSLPQSSSETSKPNSPSSSVIEDASESSSLGELRFQDE